MALNPPILYLVETRESLHIVEWAVKHVSWMFAGDISVYLAVKIEKIFWVLSTVRTPPYPYCWNQRLLLNSNLMFNEVNRTQVKKTRYNTNLIPKPNWYLDAESQRDNISLSPESKRNTSSVEKLKHNWTYLVYWDGNRAMFWAKKSLHCLCVVTAKA